MKSESVRRLSFRANKGFIKKLRKYYDVEMDTKAICLAMYEVLLKLPIVRAGTSKKSRPQSKQDSDKNKQYTITIKEDIIEALCLLYNTKKTSEAIQMAITDVLNGTTEAQKEPKAKAMYFMLGRKNNIMCNEISLIFESVKGKYNKYAEAFVGTGNVFYHSDLNVDSFINDKDARTVNFLKVLSDKPLELKVKLMLLQCNNETFEQIKCKSEFENEVDDAVAFMFVRYSSYYGLGECFDKKKTNKSYLKNLNLIYYLSRKLQGVEISKTDALYFINKHNESNVLLYIDSPYPYTEDYYKDSIDHKKLARLLTNAKSKFIYSSRTTFSNKNRGKGYTDAEMELTIDALYGSKGFYYVDVPLKNKFNEDKKEQVERLITNFEFEGCKEYR